MNTGLILHTVLGLLLLLIPAGALYLLERKMLKSFGLTIVRMVVQLLVVCLMVWALIRFNRAWLSLLWWLLMAVYAAWIVVKRCKLLWRKLLPAVGVGLFASDGTADGSCHSDDDPRTEHLCLCPEGRRTAV